VEALVRLVRVGEETRLRLAFPARPVRYWKLTVPVAGAIAEVSEGASLQPPTASGEGATLLAARASGGISAWHGAEREAGRRSRPHSSRRSARCRSRSMGGASTAKRSSRSQLRRFARRVSRPLAQGGRAGPTRSSQYAVVPVPGEDGRRPEGGRKSDSPKGRRAPVENQLNTRIGVRCGRFQRADRGRGVRGARRGCASRDTSPCARENQWRVIVGRWKGSPRSMSSRPPAQRRHGRGVRVLHSACSLLIQVIRRTPKVSLDPEICCWSTASR